MAFNFGTAAGAGASNPSGECGASGWGWRGAAAAEGGAVEARL